MASLDELLREFALHDAARRTGEVRGPSSVTKDRRLEGALMAGLMGPLAPIATLPVALAGLGYEGSKAIGQQTGLGQHLPGPFRQDETTSPASLDNPAALMGGFSEQATQPYEELIKRLGFLFGKR